MTDTKPGDHRRIIRIDPATIAAIIDLPDGAHIASVRGTWDPVGIELLVVDPAFEPVPPEACAPIIQSTREYDPETGRLSVFYAYEREMTQ